MDFLFKHLPEKLEQVKIKDPDILLINSWTCPKQNMFPCNNKAGFCCLGEKKECSNNNCPNNLLILK